MLCVNCVHEELLCLRMINVYILINWDVWLQIDYENMIVVSIVILFLVEPHGSFND